MCVTEHAAALRSPTADIFLVFATCGRVREDRCPLEGILVEKTLGRGSKQRRNGLEGWWKIAASKAFCSIWDSTRKKGNSEKLRTPLRPMDFPGSWKLWWTGTDEWRNLFRDGSTWDSIHKKENGKRFKSKPKLNRKIT